MGRDMLVEGKWRTDVEPNTDEDGRFDRWTTTFRDWIADGADARFPPEPGRYHLYVSRSCPWAHGVALVRRLTGLEAAITMDVVDPRQYGQGWEFDPDKAGCTPDTVLGSDYLHEVYTAAESAYTGRVTVPTLWDREEETIVNNESIELMRMLDDALTAEKRLDVDLYPEGYRDEIDRHVEELYGPVNNGVYRAGHAATQAAHEEAVRDLFDALDRYDALLADRRYLAGDRLTLADVRFFPTLVRFDEAYHTHFMCNVRRIVEYEHLWGYVRDLYQTPGVAATVDVAHIKDAYYHNMPSVSPQGLVPLGPDPDFTAPHERDRLPGGPPAALAEA